MDLFEAFPQLRRVESKVLQGRALRLLSISALVYDENAYYFELSQPRYWVRSAEGETTIGVGGAKARYEGEGSPLEALFQHLREAWKGEPTYFPAGQIYVVEGEEAVVLQGGDLMASTTPHLLVLTPPRLGGGEVPDALAQAVYFVRLRGQPYPVTVPGILEVQKDHLGDFLDQESWRLIRLLAQPWADLLSSEPLPEQAFLRPVLALRALRQLRQGNLFPLSLETSGVEGAGPDG